MNLESLLKRYEELSILIQCYDAYIKFSKAVEEFRDCLKASADIQELMPSVNVYKDNVLKAEIILDKFKNQCLSLNSSYSLQYILSSIDSFRAEKTNIKSEVDTINSKQFSIEVDTWNQELDRLPLEFVIGKCQNKLDGLQINEPLSLSIKGSGGLLIKTDCNQFDDKLDRFVSALVISIFKSFPLGSARVMLVDPEAKYRHHYHFKNFFAGASGEVRSLFKYIDSYKEMFEEVDRTVSTTLSKFKDQVVDMYSLYEIDSTNKFTFVICLSGITEQLSNSYNSASSKLTNMLTANSNFDKCGIKTIIIDNFKNNDYSDISGIINLLKDLSQMYLEYIGGEFSNNLKYKMIDFSRADFELCIEEFAANYASEAGKKSASIVSFEDIGFANECGSSTDSYLSVPIGKCGNEVFNLTFNCDSRSKTPEGQVIGHMVVGQSGSGKSSLFHSFIMNGAMKYRPNELEFWLLDLKENSMLSRYLDAEIPHITHVAPNSTPEDAYALLRELKNEKERRNRYFVEVARKEQKPFESLVDYNAFAEQSNGKYKVLPRIVFCIDEIQVLFNSKNSCLRDTVQAIKDIVDAGRSAGIHLMLMAQSVSKADDLKTEFVSQSIGHCTYRLVSADLRSSGYGEEFENLENQVEALPRGTMLISYGVGHLKEVRVAYCNPNEYSKYFSMIKQKHREEPRLLKIGDTSVLTGNSISPTSKKTYFDILRNNCDECFVFGENFTRLEPIGFTFNHDESSAGLIVGSNKIMATSIMASLFVGAINRNYKVYGCDGLQDDKTAFSYIFRRINKKNVFKSTKAEIDELFKTIWIEYKRRLEEKENEYDVSFEPLFVFVNDIENFNKIEDGQITLSFKKEDKMDESIFAPSTANDPDTFLDNCDVFFEAANKEADRVIQGQPQSDLNLDDINLLKCIETLLKDGRKADIYLVVWSENDKKDILCDALKESINIAMFNLLTTTNIPDLYTVRDTLDRANEKGYANAISVARLMLIDYKMRPIIYENVEDFESLLQIGEK